MDIDKIKSNPKLKAAIVRFFENYETLASYATNQEERVFLGDKSDRTCRFCGRKKGEVTYKNEAHALSNLIGNDRLFSSYECDDCNEKRFSKYESDFASYMKLYHCLAQIKGKRGIPSYKSRKQDHTRIDIEDTIKVMQQEDEDLIVKIDKEKNLVRFTGKRTYTPVNVYKCLLKMALTIIPESELPEVQNALDFLMDRKRFKATLQVIYKQHGGIPVTHTPVAMLYKRKEKRPDQNIPMYIFLLHYGNFVFQFHIPFCTSDEFLRGQDVTLLCAPTPADIDNMVNPIILDLSSSEKVIKEDYAIDMAFSHMQRDWKVTFKYALTHPLDALKRLFRKKEEFGTL